MPILPLLFFLLLMMKKRWKTTSYSGVLTANKEKVVLCYLSIPRRGLKKVLYGKENTEPTIELLGMVLDSLEPLITDRPCISDRLSDIVWEHLDRFRYLYKSEAHEYENECRFVVGESKLSKEDKEKIRFEFQDRNGSSPRVRHYYEHRELAVENILASGSAITLGPCVDYSYNMRYYLDRLKVKGGKSKKGLSPEIRVSQIPYRIS